MYCVRKLVIVVRAVVLGDHDGCPGAETGKEANDQIGDDLDEEVDTATEAIEEAKTTETKEEFKLPDVKTAPHAQTVEWLYTGIKSMVKENTLYTDDIAVLAGLVTELYQQVKEPQKEVTDSDLEDMLWDARH
jgi:hypothetical protein